MKMFGGKMYPFAANPFMFIFSIVAIAGVVLYFGYMAFDGLGLETERATATVMDKQHVARGEAPMVDIVGGRPWVRSQETPETFLLRLRLDDAEFYAPVTRSVFDQTNRGETVRVQYQRRRISGTLEVVEVSQ